jgi:hypothetical protein
MTQRTPPIPPRIYQHWVGEIVVEAGDLPAVTHSVDEWFPEEKPAGAIWLGSDLYPAPTDLFEDVIRLRSKIGPVKIRINVDLAFIGTVEHWQAPGADDAGG